MVFLIDYENLGDGAFSHISALTSQDKIIIFYRENVSRISISNHILLEKLDITKEYIGVKSQGKNALDFQLVTYLGYLIAKDGDAEYCILTKDNGFDAAGGFWRHRGYKVRRHQNLALENTNKANQEQIPVIPVSLPVETTIEKPAEPLTETPVENSVEKIIESALPKATDNEISLENNKDFQKSITKFKGKSAKIIAIIKKYKTKQGINNAIVKEYGSETAGEIYKAIKPFIKDKR